MGQSKHTVAGQVPSPTSTKPRARIPVEDSPLVDLRSDLGNLPFQVTSRVKELLLKFCTAADSVIDLL